MNLNADAGDDETFDSLFTTGTTPVAIHTDGTDETNPAQPITEQKTFITSNDPTAQPYRATPEEMFGGPLIKNELPNLNAVYIEATNNKINTTRDLVDIQRDIQNANGVSREDAELIENISPGFTDKQPLGFYTSDKSKNQLTETIRTLDSEIDIRVSTITKDVTDYMGEAHSKFTPIIQSIEQNVLDKIISLQMEVQSLSLSCGNKTTKLSNGIPLNDVLETEIGRCADSERDSSDTSSFPSGVDSAFKEIALLFSDKSSFKNKLGALYYAQLHSHKGLYLPIGNAGYRSHHNFYVELSDKAPYVKDIDKSLEFEPSSSVYVNTLYYHTTLSTGDAMVNQVKMLCGFLSAIVSSLPEQKENIRLALSDDKLNKSELLDLAQKHSSCNARDALLVMASISFLEELIAHLTALRNIYKAISSEITETSVSAEGFFDSFKKKPKEQAVSQKSTFADPLVARKEERKKSQSFSPDLTDLLTKFSDLSEKIELSQAKSVNVTLELPENISDVEKYNDSLTIYLSLIKEIENCYKKLPSILDKAIVLTKDFIRNPKDTPDKFITKAAQIYYEENNSKSNIFGNKNIIKSSVDKYGRHIFKDKNSVFELYLPSSYELLTTDKFKIGSVQKAKELIYEHKYGFSLFPSYNFFKSEKNVTKTLSSSKGTAIKLMATSMEIATTILNIRNLHYFEEGSGSLDLYEKASSLYALSEDVGDMEEEIMAGEIDLNEFIDELIGGLASWIEDHHTVKGERNDYNTSLSLIENIEVTL